MLVKLEPADSARLANLCGMSRDHLQMMEEALAVEICDRGNEFILNGNEDNVAIGAQVLAKLYRETETVELDPEQVHLALREHINNANVREFFADSTEIQVKTRNRVIKPRSENQYDYMLNIRRNDINFGIGPAGTGKTYLAVACAVDALNSRQVKRLVLVRPAVEAGEKLGFLPGDMADKIDPYLRPLYDALYEMLGFERVAKYIGHNIIEVAPLAFMRGRTLNDSFIILDEAQNTTREQMKMFLTRLGFGSSAVITGDVTQKDIGPHVFSGLEDAMKVLAGIKGIHFTMFSGRDVVRHALVQKIVRAYEANS